ncbi:hypothetical protein [Ruminiclostridium cellobioparum]|uniref:hypothetical protein n=1 Tax=Ruminiclostridium cellobioparum TaxID=29355 RepID=UPI0028AE3570|nr:hypothetical protein [Ruminiclostridium cellobioparum]
MFSIKKITSLALVLCILFVFSSQSFAASTEDSSETVVIQNNITPINKANVENALKQLVENNSITQDYADKVLAIVEKYTNVTSPSNPTEIHPNYYNPSTGASIMYIPLALPSHGELVFNKAGWDIIKEIINLGGGSTTIGLAIAALCGVTITGPIAALVGGIVVVSNASVNLQFALGNEYAVLVF